MVTFGHNCSSRNQQSKHTSKTKAQRSHLETRCSLIRTVLFVRHEQKIVRILEALQSCSTCLTTRAEYAFSYAKRISIKRGHLWTALPKQVTSLPALQIAAIYQPCWCWRNKGACTAKVLVTKRSEVPKETRKAVQKFLKKCLPCGHFQLRNNCLYLVTASA